jgi:hypothetical protein
VRRVCVTNIVGQPQARNPNAGSWTTQFFMAVLVAALAAAMWTLCSMMGWHIDT